MYKLVICDKNREFTEYLKNAIGKYMEESYREIHIVAFQNGNDVKSFLEEDKKSHIYLLNVQLPDMDGAHLGKLIRQKDQSAVIIFMSDSREFSLDLFSVHPIQYLMIPVENEKLFQAVEQAIQLIKYEDTKHFVVKCKKESVIIPVQKIAFVEYHNHQISVTTVTGEEYISTQSKTSFAAWMQPLLQHCRFIRPHSSFVVNMSYIQTISNDKTFILENGMQIPISVNRYTSVRKRYMTYAKPDSKKTSCSAG